MYERVQNDDERERFENTEKNAHDVLFSEEGKGRLRNVLRFRVNNNECYYNFTLPFLSFFLSLSLSLSLSLFLFPKREMKM